MFMGKFEPGAEAYIVANNLYVRKVHVVSSKGGLIVVRFDGESGGTCIRENRLFSSEEEAKATFRKQKEMPTPERKFSRTPWDRR